jgi:hypothetical protein
VVDVVSNSPRNGSLRYFPGVEPTGFEPEKRAKTSAAAKRKRRASRLLKKFALYRASCLGIELRLRVEPDGNGWLVIKRPGVESQYIDIPSAEIPGVVERFIAIGEDVDRFKAFVQSWPA